VTTIRRALLSAERVHSDNHETSVPSWRLVVDCLERWLDRAEDEEKVSALLDGYGA